MNRPKPGPIEDRTAPIAEAVPTVDGRKLRGLIPYGVESRDMGGWREVIDPGALAPGSFVSPKLAPDSRQTGGTGRGVCHETVQCGITVKIVARSATDSAFLE